MKIVIDGPQIAEQVDLVRQASPDDEVVFTATPEDYLQAAGGLEVVFAGRFDGAYIEAAPDLKWMQNGSAGVDWMPLDILRQRGIILTNAAGSHAVPVADTALALLMAVARGMNWTFRNQVAHLWQQPPQVFEFEGKTAGIIAIGAIGIQVARRLKGLGLRVIGVDVDTEIESAFVDEIRPASELPWLLTTADVVVCAAPLTPATHHLMNAATFAHMRDDTIFINVSRGGLVDSTALVDLLDSGRLFGAGVDVVEEEPLDREHPLWSRTDLVITPHVGGRSPLRGHRLAALFIENLHHYRAGEPLRNTVDLDAGY